MKILLIAFLTCTLSACSYDDCCVGIPNPVIHPEIRVLNSSNEDLLDPSTASFYPHDQIYLTLTQDSIKFPLKTEIFESASNGKPKFDLRTDGILNLPGYKLKNGMEEMIVQWSSERSDTLSWTVFIIDSLAQKFQLNEMSVNGMRYKEYKGGNDEIIIYHTE